MSDRPVEPLQRYLRRLCEEAVPADDAALLNRFVEAGDRGAFERLVARHGPAVLGTARRLVDNAHDAEDVFQAVFLSLARSAAAIRHGQTLPAWLHRVACRIAAKVRKGRFPQSRDEPPEPGAIVEPDARLAWQEVRQALDGELQRLPQRFRAPLVLCYLSGMTRDEAAAQLGWSLGTLKRRLEAGREALRLRLERRGIASVGLALAVLAPGPLQATVGPPLIESTLRLAFAPGTAVPATVAALAVGPSLALKGTVMKSLVALLAALAVGAGIFAGSGRDETATKAENKTPAGRAVAVPVDDPLPAGAALRFGTSRYRYGPAIHTLAVSRDGTLALAANDNDIPRVFDLATGRVRYALNWGSVEVGAFTPDGRALVLKQGNGLYVFDAATGKELRRIPGPLANPWNIESLEFTPDGRAVALISHEKCIHLIDFESGRSIRDFPLESPGTVLAVAFSPDGKRMASGGYEHDKDDYFARIWDVETGQVLRRAMHGQKGYGISSLAFSPDGKTLATLGTQAGVFLRLFDADTGRELRAFPTENNIRPDRGSVAFSPDGKTVAVALASIRLYDAATGEERLRIDRHASNLHFTDGGQTLIGAVSGAIYRWDTATGKVLTPATADSAVVQVLASPDGRRVVTRGQDSEAHIWDAATGQHLRRFPAGWYTGMAIGPDGRYLAWPVSDSSVTFAEPGSPRSIHDGSRIRLYDLVADKLVDRFPAYPGAAQDIAFTADGRSIVTVDSHPGTVRIWGLAGTKAERTFSIAVAGPKNQSYRVRQARLSPDGRTAAVTYEEDLGGRIGGLRGPPQHTRLWEVATGTERSPIDARYLVDGAFSSDGRFVVSRGENRVCEVATGKRVATLPDDPLKYLRAAAFSPDGRYLATAAGDDLHVWEVASWTRRHEFKGTGDRPTCLAFTPAGQLLAGSRDATVLAWDTRPPRTAQSASLESAWDDLAKRDASASFPAEGRLASAPARAIAIFAERVKIEGTLDPLRIRRLLAELGSNEFAVREAASKAILGLGDQAVPYLETALKQTESAEVRARVETILDQRIGVAMTSEQLRQHRAVMILELIGDGDSKNLLRKWAAGPAGARLTLEASRALTRLEAAAPTKR